MEMHLKKKNSLSSYAVQNSFSIDISLTYLVSCFKTFLQYFSSFQALSASGLSYKIFRIVVSFYAIDLKFSE